MQKEITTVQTVIILVAFAIIGSVIGLVIRGVVQEEENITAFKNEEEQKPDPEPEPEPEPSYTLEDIPSFNGFAATALKNIAQEKNENFIFSPLTGIQSLLSLYVGTNGETKQEIGGALNFSENMEKTKETFLLFQEHLKKNGGANLNAVNAFYVQRGFILEDDYKNDLQKYFNTKTDYLPETGKSINDWLKEKTDENIKNIVSDGPISPLVTSYLLSAINFNVPFGNEFDKEKTTDKPFLVEDEEIKVSTMKQTNSFSYLDSEEVAMISINYKGGDFVFHAIMPKEKSLSTFYATLDENIFLTLKEEQNFDIVNIELPRFSVKNTLQMEPFFRNIGLGNVLNPALADFSPAIKISEREEGALFVSNVLHKASLSVKEKEKSTEGESSSSNDYKTIKINRPFIFLVEEARTNNIILAGQVTNPSK